MKKNLFILLPYVFAVLFMTYSCNSSTKTDDSVQAEEVPEELGDEKKPVLECVSDLNTTAPFYIINVEAAEDEQIASDKVRELLKTNKKAAYLWIPDYASLSGKKLYSVFLGPYEYEEECMQELMKRKKTDKGAYALLVSHEKQRVEMHDKYDIRVDGKKQKLILAWADPIQVEEYFDAGGEDWGWFMNDVSEYFVNHYKNQVKMYYMPAWVPEKDFRTLVKEAGGNVDTFGYVFIDGNKKSWIEHNPSFHVIETACKFFNLKYIPH
jgi:hypothetical protein